MTEELRVSRLRFDRWLAIVVVVFAAFVAEASRGMEARNRFEVTDVGHDTIVLYRDRASGDGREGLIIDSKSLIQSLKTRVLEDSGLGEVGELSEGASSTSALRRGESAAPVFTFEHRFAAP